MRLLAILAAALAITFLVYYSAFGASIVAGGRGAPAVGAGRLLAELSHLWRLSGAIGPLVLLLGLSGVVLALRRWPPLGMLLLACAGSALLSPLSLLVSGQTLRWPAFLFPALALGGGIALTHLAERGQAARIVAYLLLALISVRGAVLWYTHVATYLH